MENNVIACKNICKSFGEKVVLNNFSCEIPFGQISAVMGASGCGKTTLLRILSGLEKADSGEISGLSGKKISFLFQEDRLLPWLTVRKNVEAVITDKEKKPLAEQILAELGLESALDLYPRQISGGMARRVAIARALAYDADILILDEALRGLDAQNIENTARVIMKYSKGKTVISVTHNPSLLEAGSENLIKM